MLNFLNADACYEALLARDPAYDGVAYVGVKSTGIFCRLVCPARKPKRENCEFYPTVGECLAAGFRPCKRCSPMAPAAQSDPVVKRLMDALDADPARRWREEDVAKMDIDPSTARRAFKRQFGMTFLALARLKRIRGGFETLSDAGKVIAAQHDAGFASSSGFRSAFAKILGVSPGTMRHGGEFRADWLETVLGPMVTVADKNRLYLLEFTDRKGLSSELQRLQVAVKSEIGIGRHPPSEQVQQELERFFDGENARFETPLAFWGSDFSKSVWSVLREIPAGETRSYGDIAKAVGRPTAARAVARANGANPLAIIVPCHRIIGADGSMTGYGGGLWRKQKLIELERQYVEGRERRT